MLTLKQAVPAQIEVIHLIEQLDEYQSSLYPPESNQLDSIEELSKAKTFFLAAYTDSMICGIGSVKLLDDYGKGDGQLLRSEKLIPEWLVLFMQQQKIELWGAADLRDFNTPEDSTGRKFPGAIAFAIPMTPAIMGGIQNGPNQAYAEEYSRVNTLINETAAGLETEIRSRGFRAKLLAASERTDPVNIKGDFPQKTAATRAGLGWIGRHCQLITRRFGSWVRLGTVFTDMALAHGTPVERSYCGTCKRCVEACPAGALQGSAWVAGMPRDEILDAAVCDRWKKENYYQYHKGHNCGICSAVCPYSLKKIVDSS